jgi:hypothetical protein
MDSRSSPSTSSVPMHIALRMAGCSSADSWDSWLRIWVLAVLRSSSSAPGISSAIASIHPAEEGGKQERCMCPG